MSYFDKCHVKFLNIKGGDIPDSEYFATPGISNSLLKLIDPLEGGNYKTYKEGFPKTYNPSLALGSFIHCLFLQPNDYTFSTYEGKPSAKLGEFIDAVYYFRKRGLPIATSISLASKKADYFVDSLNIKRIRNAIKLGLDYYLRKVNGEFNTQNGKEILVLPKNQLKAGLACLSSLHNDNQIKKWLKESIYIPKQFLNEIALFADLEVTLANGEIVRLPFKGKLDQVIIDHENKLIYLNDLKTTSKSCETFMGGIYEGEWYNGSFEKLHYMRQFSVYLMLLQMYCETILGLTDYNYLCNVIVVETTGKNLTKICPVNNSFIQYGAKEFKELICRVAYAELYGTDIEERNA